MRFKLILQVNSETYGNVIPVSYQYELSSCIHRKLTEKLFTYNNWLRKNGFLPEHNSKYRLFSISNFYIPKIKVEIDRLCILTKRVQLWISFLPDRETESLVQEIFSNQKFTIGDRLSQVEFEIIEIVRCDTEFIEETVNYISLSPIVFSHIRPNRSIEYIGPDAEIYPQLLLNSILEKYKFFYGKDFPHATKFDFEILNEPKRKGIFIKRFTHEESKVIGYMYQFKLTLHPILQQIIYNTGIGDKVSLGFGCIEVLK